MSSSSSATEEIMLSAFSRKDPVAARAVVTSPPNSMVGYDLLTQDPAQLRDVLLITDAIEREASPKLMYESMVERSEVFSAAGIWFLVHPYIWEFHNMLTASGNTKFIQNVDRKVRKNGNHLPLILQPHMKRLKTFQTDMIGLGVHLWRSTYE